MIINETQHSCPVCSSQASFYCSDTRRHYYCCNICSAVYVPAVYHLSSAAEKAEYDKHENHIDDEGYRRFLSRMANPMADAIAVGASGLDFGCGPGPALAAMLEAKGFSMSVYDKYYANNPQVLERQYDFICTTEVVEHLRSPTRVIDSLWDNLNVSGVLGVMTKRVENLEKFKRWHYKNDPTHIVFFHEKTFEWLADRLGASLQIICDDVVFLVKDRG